MMRRYAPAALVIAILLPTCEWSQEENRITAEIVEVGAFETGPGEPGSRETVFTEHGDSFTARLGLQFGFRFTLKNVPDAETFELKTVVTHPPIIGKDGKATTRYALLTTVPVTNGSSTSVTGYKFDRTDEMTPGVWTFEHSFQGKTLVKQSFSIRAATQP